MPEKSPIRRRMPPDKRRGVIMRTVATRMALLAVVGLIVLGVPLSLAPTAAQAQGFYIQIGPGYGPPGYYYGPPGYYYGPPPGYYYRRDRFCRAAYWRSDWRAMRWCRFHRY